MKLIVRAADYAMTDSITDGCLKAIRDGILSDVGLMTNNYKYAKRAVAELKKYPHVSIGQDLNLVSGLPASDPKDIPHLVDENGVFISSSQRKKTNKYDIPYAEAYKEMKLQIERCIELVGKKPVYLMGHSLSTPEVDKAMEDLAKEYDILLNCFEIEGLKVADRWYYQNMQVNPNDPKPAYSLDCQADTDVTEFVVSGKCGLDPINDQYAFLPTHCGYCDGELLGMSTFSIIRGKELEMLCAKETKKWIEDNGIELINYETFLKEIGR